MKPGWRRSADRTGLQPNSLQTGNFTGKITISGLKATMLEQETALPQDFSANSLSKLSGKFFRRTGNSKRITGNFRGCMSKALSNYTEHFEAQVKVDRLL
jgi:hypothetical protein